MSEKSHDRRERSGAREVDGSCMSGMTRREELALPRQAGETGEQFGTGRPEPSYVIYDPPRGGNKRCQSTSTLLPLYKCHQLSSFSTAEPCVLTVSVVTTAFFAFILWQLDCLYHRQLDSFQAPDHPGRFNGPGLAQTNPERLFQRPSVSLCYRPQV